MPAAVTARLDDLVAARPLAAPPARETDAAAPSLKAAAGGDEIKAAILASKPAFIALGIFSLVINVLMLTGPLFMLQVYDRVMTSGSMPTLIALTVLTTALYGVIGFLELVRTRVVTRVGVEIDQRLSARIMRASLRRSLLKPGASSLAMRELDQIRQFVSGPGPLTFFDAPWTPVYLFVVFLLHWVLGLAAVVGLVVLVALAWSSEQSTREPLREANKSAAKSIDMADSAQRNAEALTAMGMMEAFRQRWQKANAEALSWQMLASDRLGSASSVSKAVRLLMQSLMLAVGAALAISNELSAGAIVAATIIFGRALAPVEQAIGQWRSYIRARESYVKLAQLLKEEPEPPPRTALPAPRGHIEVQALRVAAPDTRKLILANLTFEVRPGQILAVIGPSASGKSTLARTLVGLWPPFGGTIRIDGADLTQWNQEALGRHLGYLPQDVELFAGSVRDNIGRFREDASDEAVVAAAKMAHAHELILALPQGYDTQLGSFGTYLSAGQRQRIGLARALFANPALVVLDEPNANLDRLGDEALAAALAGMRQRGQAVIIVSHRVQAIGIADTLLYLDRGVQRAFGPRAEVMKLFQGGGEQPAPPQPPLQKPHQTAARHARRNARPHRLQAHAAVDATGQADAACETGRVTGQPMLTSLLNPKVPDAQWHATEPWIRLGMRATVLLIGGFALFAMVVSISGAVVAPGTVTVEGNYKSIQHLDGGIVAKILVRNGDVVARNDVLVRLEDTSAKANLAIAMSRIREQLVQQARLMAERDRRERFELPNAVAPHAGDPQIAEIIASQRALFDARRASHLGELAVLNQRRQQLNTDLVGQDTELKARRRQLELASKELADVEPLFAKGFSNQQRFGGLQREQARLEGDVGRLTAEVARTRSAMAEADLKVAQAQKEYTQSVVDELRKVQGQLSELDEQRKTLEDKLARVVIRAPHSGRVHALAAHTEGGVVQPGTQIMQIVPDGERLVVEAQVQPQDVDKVRTGLDAGIRFPAFNARTTPRLSGKVSTVSAAELTSQQGRAYFTARIEITAEELATLGPEHRLLPGMPAEVYIETQSRSIMSYIMKPLIDAMTRAFREA